MKFELENVGKISAANIELNGITVIAGENNTGKSTIGKMLFCVFNSFYRVEDQIREERVKSIARILSGYYYEPTNQLRRVFGMRDLAEQIVNQKESMLGDTRLIVKEIKNYLIIKDKNLGTHVNRDALEILGMRIHASLELQDCEIQKRILQKRLEAEFGMDVGNLNNVEQRADVKLSIKNGEIDFSVIGNEEIIISKGMSLNKEIIYMDDPFILDDFDLVNYHGNLAGNAFDHRKDLFQKLAYDKKVAEFSVVDEIIAQKKLENILNIMNDVCDGNIELDDSNSFVYKTDRLNGNLKMVNLSTGLKSFAIIRRLLLNGNIDENGMVILDEPEIHLHPEWQLKFAEIMVLMQKEFKTNILLNTHSPYFLNAIEVYSEKYQIDNCCKYYMTNENDGGASLIDVTNQTERIYARLAKPLQDLENMEYGNTKV